MDLWVRVTTDNDQNAYYLDKAIAGRGGFKDTLLDEASFC